jgi:fructokinase
MPRIVVCGEALIDIVPAGNGTLVALPGGGPFTTARALGRLGVPAAYLGRLSDDGFGEILARTLREDGTDLSLVSRGPELTTLAVAELDRAGVAAYRFYVEGTSAPHLTPAMLPAALPAAVSALHIGTLGLVLEPMATTIEGLTMRESGKRLVMLDLNVRTALIHDAGVYHRRLESLMAASTVVKASDADLAWLFPDLDPEPAAERILDCGAGMAVVTLGARGAFGARRGLSVSVRAPAIDVIDTIGAGDAFNAAFLAWLHWHDALLPDLKLDSGSLAAALEFACLAASLTCARAGADPPWRAEVMP